MMRELVVRPEAVAEISAAYSWYSQHGEALGDDFLHAVETCLDSVDRQPLAYPAVHKQVRRALLRKFPYSIFYVYEQPNAQNERVNRARLFSWTS